MADSSHLCFAPVGKNASGLAGRCGLDWGHRGQHKAVRDADLVTVHQDVSPATAGGASAPDVAAPIEEVPPHPAYVENAVAGALTDMYGFLPLSVRYGAAAAARAAVESWQRMTGPAAVPDPRDAEIERLRDDAEEANTWRIRAVNSEQDLADARTSYDVALCEGNEARESWKRADAEVKRLRKELDGIRRFALMELGVPATVVTERNTKRLLTDLVVKLEQKADALTEKLDQHLADENSAQAANDRLRDDIQNLNAAHDGTMRYITNRLADILDADAADIHELLNIVSLRVEGGNAAELEHRVAFESTFQPGQRVRIGDCAGTVHKPHDITRVKLDGVPIAHDFETRFVRPTPYDEEVPF